MAPLPGPSLYPPFPAAGFPPALIPIWVRPNGLEFFGYWKHFFTDRNVSVVSCAAEDDFRVFEIGRNFEQYLDYECIRQLSNFGGISETLKRFAESADIELGPLDAISAETGDDPSALLQNSLFSEDPPLTMAAGQLDRYRGDFPCSRTPSDFLRNTCTLEYEKQRLAELARMTESPPWFRHRDLPSLFRDLVQEGDFLGAWMTLNSSGWKIDEARQALSSLAEVKNDSDLSLLAEAWCSESHDVVPGY